MLVLVCFIPAEQLFYGRRFFYLFIYLFFFFWCIIKYVSRLQTPEELAIKKE